MSPRKNEMPEIKLKCGLQEAKRQKNMQDIKSSRLQIIACRGSLHCENIVPNIIGHGPRFSYI